MKDRIIIRNLFNDWIERPDVVPAKPTWTESLAKQFKSFTWYCLGWAFKSLLKFILMMIPVLLVSIAVADDCGPVGAVPCANVRCVDGDTIHADLVMQFGLTIRDKTIRAAGYDAFELSHVRRTVNVSEVEIARGKIAKAGLEELIASGTLYAADTGKVDPYGRLLAELWVLKRGEWISVGAWMRANHHVRD
jgi:hypothetical protein